MLSWADTGLGETAGRMLLHTRLFHTCVRLFSPAVVAPCAIFSGLKAKFVSKNPKKANFRKIKIPPEGHTVKSHKYVKDFRQKRVSCGFGDRSPFAQPSPEWDCGHGRRGHVCTRARKRVFPGCTDCISPPQNQALGPPQTSARPNVMCG